MKTAYNYSEAAVHLSNIFTLLNAIFFLDRPLPQATIVILPNCPYPGFFVPRENVWSTSEGTTAEINLSAEFIGQPISEVVTVLLHEMVHYANYLDGKKDCSRGGYYHNKEFYRTATKHGLVVEYDKIYGWSKVSPSQDLLDMIQYYGLTDIQTHRNSHLLLTGQNMQTNPATAAGVNTKGKFKRVVKNKKVKYICPCCNCDILAPQESNIYCMDCDKKFIKLSKSSKRDNA